MDTQRIIRRITSMTHEAKTTDELHEMLTAIAYTIGGVVCHFDKEDRSQVLINLTQDLGMGLQITAKSIGEPSDIEMIVGNGKRPSA